MAGDALLRVLNGEEINGKGGSEKTPGLKDML
jgi:hypothetical protein